MNCIATPLLDAIAYARDAKTPREVLTAWHHDQHTDPADYCRSEPCATIPHPSDQSMTSESANQWVMPEIRAWHDREHSEPQAVCGDSLCAALRMLVFVRPETQGGLL